MTADYTRLAHREGRRVTVRWVVPFPQSPRYGTEQRVRGRLIHSDPQYTTIFEGAHERSRSTDDDVQGIRIIPSAAITEVVIHHEKVRS